MEYAIPREACAEALNRVRRMVADSGFFLNFPVEVRFTAPDEIPLSTASNRESAYIAVHIYKGMNYVPYFKEVESIMNSYQGRPHWGKLHFQSAATLASRYPQWDVFQAVRNQVDPKRMFSNVEPLDCVRSKRELPESYLRRPPLFPICTIWLLIF